MVEILNNKIIRDWFSNEFIKVNGKSVYGDIPEQFQHFYNKELINRKKINVLDLGYGDGRFTNFLIKRNVSVTGVDLTLNDNIKKKYLLLLRSDIRDFEYKKDEYDLIISNETLNYVNDFDFMSILKNIEISVKQDGYIYLSILCDFKRTYVESKREFKWAEQIDMCVNDCLSFCKTTFSCWEILDSTILPKRGERPINKLNKEIKPYKWTANNLLFIAKK